MNTGIKYLCSFAVILFVSACHGNMESQMAFPPAFQKILSHHGNLSDWEKKQTLRFQIKTPDGSETHFIDLQTRQGRVEGPGYTMGFDGKSVWVSADTTFNGDPAIYHNLYFFFFSMPFILAEEATVFSKAPPIVFEEKEYPGIKITMANETVTEIGKEFYLHYDPLSYQVAWLAYPDNNFANEKTQWMHWVRYDDWVHTERLYVPQSIAWYKYENGEITNPEHSVYFEEIEVSKAPLRDNFFAKPEGAVVVYSF